MNSKKECSAKTKSLSAPERNRDVSLKCDFGSAVASTAQRLFLGPVCRTQTVNRDDYYDCCLCASGKGFRSRTVERRVGEFLRLTFAAGESIAGAYRRVKRILKEF